MTHPPPDLLARQLAWLDTHAPDVAAAVVRAPPHAEVVEVAGVPRRTLRIDGIQLCGAVRPDDEAALQAQRIPPGARTATVYGVAQGDLPRVLLRRPELQRLEVVVLEPGALREVLTRFDQAGWMQDPRVRIRVPTADERPLAPWALAPAALRLADPAAWTLRDQLVLALGLAYQQRGFAYLDDQLHERLVANAELLATDGDVAELFGRASGRRVVVAGSGPTLANEAAWLRAHRETVTLVAVNSALRPLLLADIVPDVVVAVDGHENLVRHLACPPALAPEAWAILLAPVPLVYAPALHPDALRGWPGPRYATLLSSRRYDPLEATLPRGRLWCAGTVTQTALDLAARMGATDIVLVGVDLGYPDDRTHAEGAVAAVTVPAHERRYTIEDGLGGAIRSDVTLIGYLRDLEDWIADRPHLRVRKRGRAGARMRGAPWLDDREDGDDARD
jgi:hypothetical protein